MNGTESKELFEMEEGFIPENSFRARLACLKDFLKKCLTFPLALLLKVLKTAGRAVALCFGIAIVLITLGSSVPARAFFLDRAAILARDLADWFLYPLALLGRILRLLAALLFHPRFY